MLIYGTKQKYHISKWINMILSTKYVSRYFCVPLLWTVTMYTSAHFFEFRSLIIYQHNLFFWQKHCFDVQYQMVRFSCRKQKRRNTQNTRKGEEIERFHSSLFMVQNENENYKLSVNCIICIKSIIMSLSTNIKGEFFELILICGFIRWEYNEQL